MYIEAFEADTGIEVRWVRLSAGEVVARLTAEKARPQMSVWFGGPSPEFIVAAERDLLAAYAPKIDYVPADGFRDSQDRWQGIYFGVIGIASNPVLLARHGIEPPTSWAELVRPELSGEVSYAYAYTSGTAYTLVASLVDLWGEDAAIDYLRRLDRNVHHYNKSGSACVTQVALGEIGVGVAFSQDILKKGVTKGYPVTMTFPREGTGSEVGGVAVIAGAPQRSEAERFVDWVMSLRAQTLMQKGFRIPVHPRAPVAPQAEVARHVKLIQLDAKWAAREQPRIIERWREATAQ